KAEESNRLKTAFLNNMSHEIRTPLNGITGFIGILQDSEIDDEEKQQFFDIINRSSERLIATVTDIMDISRIEAGEVKVSKSEVSVNEILEEQYNFFYHQAQSKGLELIYKPSLSDSEARFVTDKHILEGILINLIKNAIKFTDQGKITFACSLKKEHDIDVLEFYIKDTGIGIPANRIEAIFNRFEQADIEDRRAFEGSGLGLAIAKSYVEMLGGDISVKSKEGEGSTFTFSIPYTKQFVKESDAKENTNKEPQVSLSNLSVIIAEDDE
ncbi:hybrid sensor histidine kinase/response regulator, partial [Lentimicrobium sp. L6]|uniref:sensor histidine kinase n=1 Tax=Lentimicrobium sp. L6 TaxID=2735916 RepID=UPI0020A684EB